MIHLIVGRKGKGKTRILLEQANEAVKTASGNLVYLDKSTKHMYDLHNRIRLINAFAFPLKNADEFVGFLCGVISQDHDLETMYLDSFLKLARLEDAPSEKLEDCIMQLDAISRQYQVDFVLSVSLDREELGEALQDKIDVAL